MREGWELLDFEKCLLKVPSTAKIPKKKFLTEGAFPIVSQEEEYINGYWDNEDDVFKVEKPVVLFGDHTKIVKLVDFDFVKGADGIKVFLPKEDINSKFFAYQLQSLELKDLGYARHYRLLKKKKISIPPLPEQKQIVAILDKAFTAIDQAQANIEKNIENAKELFQSKLNDIFSQKGDGWEVKTLGEVCENLDSKRVPITKSKRESGEIPYYGASGIVDYVADYIFDEDLLLVSEDGANLLARTYPIAFSISGKTWVNNHAHALKFQSMTSQVFIEYYLNSIKLDDFVSGMAQPKLNQRMLNSIPVPFPSVEIQEKVVFTVEKLNAQISNITTQYEQKMDSLEELKKSILQKAFAGELTQKPVAV